MLLHGEKLENRIFCTNKNESLNDFKQLLVKNVIEIGFFSERLQNV